MCAQDSRYEEDKKLKQDEETFGTSNEWMNPGNVSCAMKLCKERKKQKNIHKYILKKWIFVLSLQIIIINFS